MDPKSTKPLETGEARAVIPGHAHVEIEIPNGVPAAKGTRIVVNGVEIQNAVVSLEMPYVRPGDLVHVVLGLQALDGVRFRGSAYVGVAPETVALLTAWGWTPPVPEWAREEGTEETSTTEGEPSGESD